MLAVKMISVNHPSRTRARQTGVISEDYTAAYNSDFRSNLVVRVRTIEFVSAVLSLAGLIVTFFVVNNNPFSLYLTRQLTLMRFDQQSASSPVSNAVLGTALDTSFKAIDNALLGQCKNQDMVVGEIKSPWNVETEFGSAKIAGVTVSIGKPEMIDAWLLLRIVLAVSVYFQFSRWWAYSPLHIITWPATPIWDRWQEYAITAPLQLVIIASTFGISDTTTHLLLFVSQAALCLLGYLNEFLIDEVWKTRCKVLQAQDNRELVDKYDAAKKEMYVSFLWTWTFFAATWYVLIERYIRQIDYWCNCGFNCDTVPLAGITTIIVVELICFAGFGIVQTVQAMKMQFGEITAYESISQQDDATDESDYKNTKRAEIWISVSVYYAILSVTSKLALEVGLIFLLVFSV